MKNPRPVVPKSADQVNLRLPEGMRDRIRQEADEKGRSINTEIVRRLERSLDDSDENTIQTLREQLNAEFSAIRQELAKLRELMLRKR
jgi:hypothetical protein